MKLETIQKPEQPLLTHVEQGKAEGSVAVKLAVSYPLLLWADLHRFKSPYSTEGHYLTLTHFLQWEKTSTGKKRRNLYVFCPNMLH